VLLDGPFEFGTGAVDVNGEEGGAAGGIGPGLVLFDKGPDDAAVGVGKGEAVDLALFEPGEFTFAHGLGFDPDGLHDAVIEHEPVGFVFVAGFADDGGEVEVGDIDVDAGFFGNFALGALGGGLAGVHVELAADG